MLSDEIQGLDNARFMPPSTGFGVKRALMDRESAADYDDAQLRCVDARAPKLPLVCSFQKCVQVNVTMQGTQMVNAKTLTEFLSVSYTFCPLFA